MTLPASGAISIGDIATEFGFAQTNISFSSLYRANGYTSGAVAANGIANISSNFSISESGQIALNQFYSAQKGFKYVANITTATANYVLSDAANTAGWNGIIPIDATITIDSSQFVYATSTSAAAFRITPSGTLAGGSVSRVRLINNGVISGKGGYGGPGSSGGENGGPGLSADGLGYPIDVNNLGTVAGGGGGGGGGTSGTGTDGGEGTASYGAGGGGGGAGYSGGAGGGGSGGNYPGGTGGTGSWNAGGGGGGGGSGNGVSAGPGGSGGSAGNNGSNGSGGSNLSNANGPWGGGAGGSASINSSNITWVNTGSRLGAIS